MRRADNLFDVYPTRTMYTLNATYSGALTYDPIRIHGTYYYLAYYLALRTTF